MHTQPPASAAPPACEMEAADIASTRAPSVALVRGVHWRVAAGDFWIIGSPAGAGKTALLQTAAGIQRPLAGQVRLFGQNLEGLREPALLALRRRTGLVFEGGGRLFPHLTVGQNIALPWCYHHDCGWPAAQERLRLLLEWTGLTDYAGLPPAQLPRALTPRVGLARGLMLGPELLLLDHPMRSVEAPERAWWRAALDRLRAAPPFPPAPPPALVLAVEDLPHWFDTEAQFAFLVHRQFLPLGGATEARQRLAAHDLLASPPGAG